MEGPLSATIRFKDAFSRSSSRSRLASSAFMPPYWFRQRWKVFSETPRALATSAVDLPSPSIRSASRSLAMTWLGVWRFAFTVSGSSLPILAGGKNSHTGRTDLRGSGHDLPAQRHIDAVADRRPARPGERRTETRELREQIVQCFTSGSG